MTTMHQLLFILTTILLISVSDSLLACSCIGKRTVKEEVKHSDAVVIGTILSNELVTLTDSSFLKMFPNDSTMRNSPMAKMTIARYDLFVTDIYKGKITNDTLTIYTGLGGGDCGIGFEIGKKYIIYGEKETYFGQVNNHFNFPKAKNTFWTYNCLRTTSIRQDEIMEIQKFATKKKRKPDDK
jgi:hypothetical protein